MTPITAEPSTSRGEITLQPSYFTSSLYVNPLREDIAHLVTRFAEQYQGATQAFELFKKLWVEQGWCWLHLRVYDGRARQTFLHVTERLFVERLADTQNPLARVVALFSLYTFYTTQPSSSAPPIYSATGIAIPVDTYESMTSLPSALAEPALTRLRPYVIHVLTKSLDAQVFRIMPHSSLRAQNPSQLPREIFIPEGQSLSADIVGTGEVSHQASGGPPPKKKGRPSKRDKMRKARDALLSLEKYVERNTVLLLDQSQDFLSRPNTPPRTETAHVVFGQAPHGSLSNYFARKNELQAAVQAADVPDATSTADVGETNCRTQAAFRRANEAVLARLKQIDAMAAEKGLEVGGEGGEKTGLARVERAMEELRQCTGSGATTGILGLLEGAGMEGNTECGDI